MALYDRLVGFFRPLIRVFFPYRLVNCPESLPESGVIVCPNHISFFDPLFLAISLPRNLTFMAKEELFHRPIIGGWLKGCGVIPLTRDGGDAAKLRQAVRQLKEGKVMTIFPQGTRCRRPLHAEDFKAGAGLMSVLSGAQVLPVGIFAKKYKVRLFRRTYIHFGELLSLSASAELSKKDQSLAVTEQIFQSVSELEQAAREQAEK